MTSAMVEQRKENPDGRPSTWTERRITRAYGSDDKNGDLAAIWLDEQNMNADQQYSERALPRASPNQHLLVRDDYPEVVHAESSAAEHVTYHIPQCAPEIMVQWAKKLIYKQSCRLCRMDPLSSPHELSPMHVEGTPLVWFTPADMKMFLRPSDEGLEEAWRQAITLLCYTVHILRECCELTDFRQTSFGSTYMALLGCARTLKVATLWTESDKTEGVVMRKSSEGLYMTQTDHDYYLDQWEKMRSQSEIVEGPEIVPITYSNDDTLGMVTDCRGLTKKTCGLAVVDEQQSLIADMNLDTGITGSTRIAGAIERRQQHVNLWHDSYHFYREMRNQVNNVRKRLGYRFAEAWDSWPNQVWKVTTEGVEIVKAHIALQKTERTTGIFTGLWNFTRSVMGRSQPVDQSMIKQEMDEDTELIHTPTRFPGELPINSIVSLNC